MLIEMMSEDLKLTIRQINKIIGNSKAYKKYYINKKRGGTRAIYHPSKELKVLQRWLVANVFFNYPVSEYSTAYEKGCSISRNALLHAENNFILHIDIENFFESIKPTLLSEFFHNELDEDDIKLICRIVMFKGGLTIGSVSSPCIANRLLYTFDTNLVERLQEFGNFTYTRYADDMIISSRNFIHKEIVEIVDDELNKLGLRRNANKTYFTSKKHKRQINGVVLDNNNGNISYGTENLVALKKEVYKFVINCNEIDEIERMKLLGKLAYLKSINENQYRSIVNKYKTYPNGRKLFINHS